MTCILVFSGGVSRTPRFDYQKVMTLPIRLPRISILYLFMAILILRIRISKKKGEKFKLDV